MTALGPGSPAPRGPHDVEALLRTVPEVSYAPELSSLLPAPLGSEPLSADAVSQAVTPQWLQRLIVALEDLERRAREQDDGGLRFVAVTLRHFVTEQKIAPVQHPLVVALFVRTAARRDGTADVPAAVARVLDQW
ncbi:MAG: hypothetical protein K0V04_22665 [Deltaproteobacteria bacterium]|nr:hypothetical protein [Deltaproteobacteria bacterium]